jgi:hypothetical protein
MRKPFISSGRQSHDGGQHSVHTFRIDDDPGTGSESAREHLKEAMDHAHRFARGSLTTIVLDVQAQNGQCSLDPGSQLPKDLVQAVGRARRDGLVWHPVKNEGVPMPDAVPVED